MKIEYTYTIDGVVVSSEEYYYQWSDGVYRLYRGECLLYEEPLSNGQLHGIKIKHLSSQELQRVVYINGKSRPDLSPETIENNKLLQVVLFGKVRYGSDQDARTD